MMNHEGNAYCMNDDKWMHYCRVCGLDQEEPAWWGGRYATFNICDCCGTTFGYEDIDMTSIQIQRGEWLSNPEKWWYPKAKPSNWDYKKQMKNIPKQYL